MKKKVISSEFRLGILGGGQLGKMLIQSASRWDINCDVLDPNPACPAAAIANHFEEGDFTLYDDVVNFGRNVDLLTIEIENVNVQALRDLEKEGVSIFPKPDTIEIIKNKGLQKKFYRDNNLNTSEFEFYETKQNLQDAVGASQLKLPFVWKRCTEGYDGRGVAIVRSESGLESLPDVPSIAEPLVAIEKEISVIVSRNEAGEENTFSPVEMQFSDEANLVEMLLAPADLTHDQEREAVVLAERAARALDHVGILAVEMFLTKTGEILINESAPRPHNSGHHTIEANVSSQYEQHLRAILGMPLGSTEKLFDAAMINLLGHPEHTGAVIYRNLEEALSTPQVYVHIYGKKTTKPFRKMGHITLCGHNRRELMEKARSLKNHIRVEAE